MPPSYFQTFPKMNLNQFYLHSLLQLHIVFVNKIHCIACISLFYHNYPKMLALLPLFVIAVQMAARRYYIEDRHHNFIEKLPLD